MAMSLAAAAASTRQCLSDVNPDGSNPFIEKLLVQIYKHFDGQYLIDVTFKLSNPTALVTAHRLILSAASPYFKELFQSGAGICPLVEITDIDSDTFERLITFCYTGKTLITMDNVDCMLKAAMVLQLDDAVANCVDFLIEHITDYSLERAYALERDAHCNLLSEKILEYEIANFMSVIQSSEFLNFDASKLQTILESDDLNVPTEKDAFTAVKSWYEHNASARKQHLSDIMSSLRLTQFDTNFIMSNIHPLPGCELMSLNAVAWKSCPPARSKLTFKWTKPRAAPFVISEESFLALNIREGEARTIFQYNKTDDLWQKCVDIDTDVEFFKATFMDENLFLIGGRRNNKTINEVRSWHFKTKTFQQLCAMNQPRYLHCVANLDDKIYAIGGMGANGEYLQSVEMYSVSNGWKSINSMITPRSSASAVVLSGKIYVIGGWNGKYLKSVECYDPTTNCWTECADMNEGHYLAGAAVHNGQIFVVGGWNASGSSPTVERYDPQINEWTKVVSGIALSSPSCISIDNQLWAVGGYNPRCTNFVSVYDEQNNKWMDKKPMPIAGVYHCFSVPKSLFQSEIVAYIQTLNLQSRLNRPHSHSQKYLSSTTTLISKRKAMSLAAFCYTGKTLITMDNVDRTLKVAMMLQLNDAVADCVDFLIDHISGYTLERIYNLEREAHCELLSEKILEYEIGNFMRLIQSSEFLNFDASKLQTILESDDLNVPTEKDAFAAVKTWYEHDASARKKHLPDIMSCLRWTQFDTNFIMSNIHPLPGCELMSLNAVAWKSCPPARSKLTFKWTKPRAARIVISEQSFLALNICGGKSITIFQYDKTEDLWPKCVDIDRDVELFEVTFMDENLFLIGGRRNYQTTNEVRSWNFKTKTFQKLPAMNQPRCFHCVVKLDDKIYAIGGKGANDEYLKSVDMYSVSNGWKSINSMITPRSRANAVVLNGQIYLIGGWNGGFLKSVECYDPTTNCWTYCADMNEKLCNRGAAVHNGQIFVVGGFNGTSSPTVERYDPQRNEWTKICSLSIGLYSTGCISVDNQLWAVGGHNQGFTNYVSVYDEQNDKWMDKKPMPIAGVYHCFSVPKSLLRSE